MYATVHPGVSLPFAILLQRHEKYIIDHVDCAKWQNR